MVGFEVYANGKRLYTIGIGDFGVMSASVTHARVQTQAGPIHDEIHVYGQGHSSTPQGPHGLVWEQELLKVGDEITIRIIETVSVDQGRPLGQKKSQD